MVKDTKSYKTYRIEIPNELWGNFKSLLRKVYWKEGITVNQGIVKLMENFVKENE